MRCPIIKTNLAIEVFGVTNKRCKQHKGLAKPAVIMMKSHWFSAKSELVSAALNQR